MQNQVKTHVQLLQCCRLRAAPSTYGIPGKIQSLIIREGRGKEQNNWRDAQQI